MNTLIDTLIDFFYLLRYELPYVPRWIVMGLIDSINFELGDLSYDEEEEMGAKKRTVIEVIPGLAELIGQIIPVVRRLHSSGYRSNGPFFLFRYLLGINKAFQNERERLVPIIEKAALRDEDVILLGHSLGSIISLMLFVEYHEKVRRCICLVPPLAGARLIRLFYAHPAIPLLFRGVRELDPASACFADLIKKIQNLPLAARKKIVFVIGENDRINSPFEICAPGIRVVKIPTGHLGLLYEPEHVDRIASIVQAAT